MTTDTNTHDVVRQFPCIDDAGHTNIFTSFAEQLDDGRWSGSVEMTMGTVVCPFVFDTPREFHQFAEAEWRRTNNEPDFPYRWDRSILPRREI